MHATVVVATVSATVSLSGFGSDNAAQHGEPGPVSQQH